MVLEKYIPSGNEELTQKYEKKERFDNKFVVVQSTRGVSLRNSVDRK